jgi:ATP-dependent DNA ligase
MKQWQYITAALIGALFILSVSLNIVNYVQKSKNSKRKTETSPSKNTTDELEKQRKRNNLERYIQHKLRYMIMVQTFIDELATPGSLDRHERQFLGHTDLKNMIFVTLNAGYHHNWVSSKKNMSNDTITYFGFEYPETEEKYNAIIEKYNQNIEHSFKELQEFLDTHLD